MIASTITSSYSGTVADLDSMVTRAFTSETPLVVYGFKKLTLNQKKLSRLFNNKNKSKLIGLRVKVIADKWGKPFNGDVKGLIVALPVGEQSMWSIIKDNDGALSKFYLFQLDLLDQKPAKPTDIKKQILKLIVEKASNQRRIEASRLVDNITGFKNTLKSLSEQTKKYEQDLKNGEERQQDLAKTTEITEEFLINQIKSTKKHSLVDTAYITKTGHIIVKTKSLKAIINTKDVRFLEYIKGINLDIGKFVFHISYHGDTWRFFSADNIDWGCCDCHGYDNSDHTHRDYYPHPNIKDSKAVCFGSNENDAYAMWRMGQIYQLVDFMITFFSTFPHDNGSPYIGYEQWLKYRFYKGEGESYKSPSYFLEDKLTPRL